MLFDSFKRVKNYQKTSSKRHNIRFSLQFDHIGAYIESVSDKGVPIEVSYQDYSGATRHVLRSLQQIREQNNFNISWDNPSARAYLHEYDYLLDQLQHCDNFIDAHDVLIHFSEAEYRLQVSIVSENIVNPDKLGTEGGKKEKFTSHLSLVADGHILPRFVFVSENYAYSEGLMVLTEPIGAAFSQVMTFETSFEAADMVKFLSLLYSYIDNVSVVYSDFKFEKSSHDIVAEPCLFFEKVDADNSLHLRIGQSLPKLGLDFLDEYEIYRFADINDLERTVYIRNIEQQATEGYVSQIEKLLAKHSNSGKGKRKLADVVLEGTTFIIPTELAAEFIYNELPNLLTSYKVFGAEKLKSYKLVTRQPILDLSLSYGIDFLEGDVKLDFGTEKLSLFDVLNQYNKNRYVLLADGSHALLNEAYIQKLQRLFKKKKDKTQISFFDLPLVEELIDEKMAEKQFKQSRAFFKGINELANKKEKLPKIKATLRPYQEQGVKWLRYLQQNKFGGCLADDMGLGKTLQTITLLACFYPKEKQTSLIVMPKSLIFNWENEVKKFAPQLTTYTYYGNNRSITEGGKAHIILTTYAMLRNDIEDFQKQNFFYVVLDESQNIKNMQSQTTKAAFLLNANHRLALSGTPIENNLGELYALFRFLNPPMFGTPENFNNSYLYPIQKDNDTDVTHELRTKISPFILRRLKKDVLTELPDKIEQTLFVEMSEEQTRLYENRRAFYKKAIDAQIAEKGVQNSQFYIFQALNELRQIASIPEAKSGGEVASPKLELLMEQLQEVIVNNHKALVFVNYLAAIELIGEALDEQGIDYVSMTGSTKDRQRLVDRFQKDTNCKVFLMTLKTGGTGLNLTAADRVFIFDPWWNKAAESQAIDRSHRIGQDKTVWSYKLITQNSIEEKILLLQERKAELFNSIISADSASIKSFSEADIKFILGK